MKKKTSVLLANPMKSVLDRIDMGTMKEWNFTAEDGTEIKGIDVYKRQLLYCARDGKYRG